MTPAAPAKVRVFAAIELSAAWREYLAALAHEFKPRLDRNAVRWQRPEGIHLTLKFYGEVKPDVVPAIERSLQQAAAGSRPFTLQLNGLGIFPSPRAPRVVWVGLTGDLEALGQLQEAVEAGGAALGFAPEARGFSPHLTLGRFRERLSAGDQRALTELLARPVNGGGELRVTSLSLIRSELRGPQGPRYTQLLNTPLSSPAIGPRL